MFLKVHEAMEAQDTSDKVGVSDTKGSRKVLKWFVNFTSLGGFTQTRDSDNKISTVIWGALFLAGLVLTIWSIVVLIITYYEYNIVTNIGLGHNSSGLIFPSVAVCNQNRIHCGHLYDKIIKCSKDSECHAKEVIYCEIFVMTQCSVSLTVAHVVEFGERKWENICESEFNKLSAEQYKEVEKIYHADESLASSMLYDLYMTLTAEEMRELGHKPKDMIKECMFEGQNHTICKEFMENGGTEIYVPKFGVCHVLNFKGLNDSDGNEELKARNAGSDHGLKLILDIQSQYYMRNGMTEKQGISLTIEENSKLPNVVSEHIQLNPHTSSYIALYEKKILRLKKPYPSDCITTFPDKYKNLTTNGEFEFSYSEKTCQSMCHNYYVHQYCGCYMPATIEGSLGWTQFSNSTFCADSYTKTDPCFDNAREFYNRDNEKVCECSSECEHPIYEKQISNTLWPSDAFLPKVSAKYGHPDATESEFVEHFLNSAVTLDHDADGKKGKLMDEYMKYVAKNLLEVNIFFTSLTYENIQETPAMDVAQLMSNLGGVIGLYLGVSIVAAFEVFELIIRLIISCFYKDK